MDIVSLFYLALCIIMISFVKCLPTLQNNLVDLYLNSKIPILSNNNLTDYINNAKYVSDHLPSDCLVKFLTIRYGLLENKSEELKSMSLKGINALKDILDKRLLFPTLWSPKIHNFTSNASFGISSF